MQDIPKNKLLDKLAAGWKVRRKAWPKNSMIATPVTMETTTWSALLADDWEGEPPRPTILHARCSISFAIIELSGHGVAFIRRPNWVHGTELYKAAGVYTLNAEDILSNDWEIWA